MWRLEDPVGHDVHRRRERTAHVDVDFRGDSRVVVARRQKRQVVHGRREVHER